MNRYRFTFAFVMCLVLLVFALVLASRALAAPAATSRYVSQWTLVQPGETQAFEHGLGTRPLELWVWVLVASSAGVPAAAIPYQDLHLPRGDIRVTLVSDGWIYVQNLGEAPQWLQVVAGR